MAFVAKRLRSGSDLKLELQEMATANRLPSGVLLSAVGSLERAVLRNAGATQTFDVTGPLEIVSATGTISEDGMHVHIAVSTPTGETIGGHLLEGCIVASTVEAVIGTVDKFVFARQDDPHTKYKELVVKPV